jgi:uncharacterized membrane protein
MTASRSMSSRAAAPPRPRVWEVDLLRTLAIAAMVVYHLLYDIDFLAPGAGPDPRSGVLGAMPPVIASTFLFLAGVSVVLSSAPTRDRWSDRRDLRRVAVLLLAAGAVSAVTAVVVPDRPVRFGILHLLAVAALSAPVLRRQPTWALAAIAAALVLAGGAVDDLQGNWLLLPLGAPPPGVGAVDYWPILPWLAAFVVGIVLGRVRYGPRGRRWADDPGRRRRLPTWLTAPGRHSLAVYLAHQPVLLPLTAATLSMAGVPVTGV